jgi:hypothetical protein
VEGGVFMSAIDNMKKFQKIVEFIQSLDDEGIETFIQVGKNQGHNIGDETKFRQILKDIRDRK